MRLRAQAHEPNAHPIRQAQDTIEQMIQQIGSACDKSCDEKRHRAAPGIDEATDHANRAAIGAIEFARLLALATRDAPRAATAAALKPRQLLAQPAKQRGRRAPY